MFKPKQISLIVSISKNMTYVICIKKIKIIKTFDSNHTIKKKCELLTKDIYTIHQRIIIITISA